MISGLLLRGIWTTFSDIFENGEIVKISTTLEPQLDFQGLAGFGSVCFVLFFGVWFLDGFGNGFLVIWEWIWDPFCPPKAIKHVIDFGIDFWNGSKIGLLSLARRS